MCFQCSQYIANVLVCSRTFRDVPEQIMQTAILMDDAAPSAAANHAGTSGTAGVVNSVAHAAGGVPATTFRTLSVVFLLDVLVYAGNDGTIYGSIWG